MSAAEGLLAWDVRFAYLPAAEAVLDGESPYPAVDDPILEDQKGYVYPPQLVLLLVPLTILPVPMASFLVALGLLALVFATLYVLEIRDVRCYAAAAIWVPTISGVLLGNVSIPLAFALAVVWRYRDAVLPPAVSLGSRGVGKAAALADVRVGVRDASACARSRSRSGSARSSRRGVGDASGSPGSPSTRTSCERLSEIQSERSYSIVGMASTLGLSEGVGQVVTLVVGVALLVGCVVLARRGRRGAVVHVRRRGDAGAQPDRLAALPRPPPRSARDPATALLVPLAAARRALGEPAARLRGGVRDLHAGARGGHPRRRAPRPASTGPSVPAAAPA